jgi:hypothetical protein
LGIETDPEATYPGLTEKTQYKLTLTTRGNLEALNIVSQHSYSCSRRYVEKVFDAKRSDESVTATEALEIVGRGCHSHLVAAVVNELKRLEKTHSFKDEPVPRALTDDERLDIVQRYLADGQTSGYELKDASQWNRYVLIIDEINRGNISKILGELITLLERDKRLPGDNSLIVTLPYSGERFAVPANLAIVGTMNTTDKSIALVDIALRRRFDFEETKVDLSVCENLTEEMRFVVGELNRRIVLRKDRDHQIGHAYFMQVSDEAEFNERFRKQVIPLLQEYFFNDWDGLKFALAQTSTVAEGMIRRVKGSDVREARTKWQWYFDDGEEALNCLQTLLQNYKLP